MEYSDILYGDIKNTLYITYKMCNVDICGEKYDIEYVDYRKNKRKITNLKDEEKIKKDNIKKVKKKKIYVNMEKKKCKKI